MREPLYLWRGGETPPLQPLPPVQLAELGPADAAEMTAVNAACPIVADFTIAFDRGDDYLAWPRLCFERFRYLGARIDGRLIGYGMIAATTGELGGRQAPYFYAGDARVLPAWRGRGVVWAIAEAIQELVWDDVHEGLGLVKAGNVPAEALIRRLCGLPRFEARPLGTLDVTLLPVLRGFRGDPSAAVRPARADDASCIAVLYQRLNAGRHFAPRLDEAEVSRLFTLPGLSPERWWIAERAGTPVGALAAWDMSAFHGSRVLRYSAGATVLRGVIAAAARVLPGVAPLPAPGGALRAWTVSQLAVTEPGVLRALLGAVVDHALGRGVHLVQLGLLAGDPLLTATAGLPRQQLRSGLYHANRRGRPWPDVYDPLIDLARI